MASLNSSAAFTAEHLHQFASSSDQMKLPVKIFCNALRASDQLSILSLLQCSIHSIWVYHAATHDYMLAEISPSPDGSPFTGPLWARCERHPGQYTGGPLFLSSTAPSTFDTVTLSYDIERLKAPGSRDALIMSGVNGCAQVQHLIDVLSIIQQVSPLYEVASSNCWWFANVTFGTLMTYGGGAWTKHPESSNVKRIVGWFGKTTKPMTDEVTRQFLAKWPTTSPLAQLSDSSTWQNPSASSIPLSPPSPHRNIFRRLRVNTIDTMVSAQTAMEAPSLEALTPTEEDFFELEDTTTVEGVVRRVMTRPQLNSGHALLAVYNVFTTGEKLFKAITEYYDERDTGENPSRPVRDRVTDFMQMWTQDDFVDMTVLPQIVHWLDRRGIEVSESARNLVRVSHHRRGSSATGQPTIVTTIPSEQIHANERSYVNFSKKDLKILALDLRAKEFQIRSRFTPTFIVLELVKKGSSGSLKLSNNSSEIRNLVWYTIFGDPRERDGSKRITERFEAYQKTAELVERCLRDRNYASAQDILSAFDPENVSLMNLHCTRKLADVENTLEKLRQRIPRSTPKPSVDDDGALYSFATHEAELDELFSKCHSNGEIDWEACKRLYQALKEFSPVLNTPNYNRTYEFLNASLRHASHPGLRPSLSERGEAASKSDQADYFAWRLRT